MLMKPGPAISTLLAMPVKSRLATIVAANSRGFLPICLAAPMAQLA